MIGCSLEGRLMDLVWICETAIFGDVENWEMVGCGIYRGQPLCDE